jgi:hypothetical protein
MARDYSRTHEHQDVPVSPAPRLQHLYRDHEFQQIHFEPVKPFGQKIVEKPLGQKIVEEPLGQKIVEKPLGQKIVEKPLGQMIVRPIEVHRHSRRGTLEFETASDLEYS